MRPAMIATAALACALPLTACGAGTPPPPPAASAAPGTVEAAQQAAKTAAGGAAIGGTLTLLGQLSGAQQEAYLGTLKPFMDATGIEIKYESTKDMFAVLQSRIAGGNPPDVVSNASAGQMKDLAAAGKLIPLDEFVDVAKVRADYPEGLVDLAGHAGKLYGIFYNSAVSNLVWYDPTKYTGPKPPATWQELDDWAAESARAGTTPWCIGMESGPASGWPGAVWVEQFMLQEFGGEVFDQWWQGRLPWTSPQLKTAFERFGRIAADEKMVSGGAKAVLTTSFNTSPNGLYTKPPSCLLHMQGDWLGNALAQSVPGVTPEQTIDFFPFPAIDPALAGSVEISGEMLGLLKDTPQGRAFMRYVATPEFSALVAGTGQWIGANRRVPLTAYTSPLSRKAAEVYANAKVVRYSAHAAMPLALTSALWKAVTGYVKQPADLDARLAELERLRETSY